MAHILGLEIDGDVVRGALMQVALRHTELERYVEARVMPEVADAAPAHWLVPAAPAPMGLSEQLEGVEDPAPLGGAAAVPPNTDAHDETDGETDDEDAAAPSDNPDSDVEQEVPASPLALAVAEAVRQCGRAPDSIIMHLDGRYVSLRPLTLPAGAAKSVAQVLPGELEPMLPFDVADAVLHHQLVSSEELEFTILAAAVKRSHVAARLAELASAGVNPRQLAAGAATLDGLVPLVAALNTGAPTALVDMGRDTTDICILRDGRAALARTISVGMDALRAGESGAAEELSGSLKRTLANYRMKGGPPLERVLVGGDGAAEPAARDLLTDCLGCLAEVVSLPAGDGMIAPEVLPRFMRAAALAGRATVRGQRIDLRQGEFVSRHAVGELRRYARLAALCAAAILTTFLFSLYTHYSVLQTERAELRAQLGILTESVFRTRTDSPTRARELLRGGSGERDPMPRLDAYRAMGAIAELIPQDTRHTTRRLTIEFDDEARDGELEIQGTVSSVTERDAIAAALEGHECFSEVRPGATSSRNDILSYRLEAEIRCPGDQPEPDDADSNSSRRRDRGN